MRGIVAGAFAGTRLCASAEAQIGAGGGAGPAAALKTHQIKHKSFLAALAGVAVGAVIGAAIAVGVAALVGTGVGAIVVGAVASAALTSAPGISDAIGSISSGVSNFIESMGSPQGPIISGSPDVTIEGMPAARAIVDTVTCKKHKSTVPIADGSTNVFINGYPAARVGDKITCGGGILQGAKKVFIGGGSERYLDVDDDFSMLEKAVLLGVEFLVPPSRGALKGGAKMLFTRAGKGMGALCNVGDALRSPKAWLSKRSNNKCKPLDKRKTCGDPIDVVTGEVVELRTDLTLGRTIPLTLTRYHRSGDAGSATLGPGWRDSWHEAIRIRRTPEGLELDLERADGVVVPFDLPRAFTASTHPQYPELRLERRAGYFAVCDLNTYSERHFAVSADGDADLAFLVAELDAYGNRIDYQRDEGGRLRRIVHSDGIVLGVEHEAQGRLCKVVRFMEGAPVELVRYRFEHGYLVEAWSRSEGHLFYRYNRRGLLAEWRDTNHTWSRYTYDAHGRCIANESAGGFYNSRLHYDPINRITRAADSQGRVSVYRYNAQNLVTHVTNPLGETSETVYDALERVIAEIDPLGRRRETVYDEQGRVTAVIAPNGAATAFEYDGEARQPKSVTNALGQTWRYRYNFAGQPVAVESPLGHVTRHEYTDFGMPAALTTPGGRTLRWEYDAAYRLAAFLDGEGHATRFEYDRLDRCSAQIDPQGHITRYEYNDRDRLIAQIDPEGNRSTIEYDGENNPVTWTDAEGRQEHAAYGPFDLPTMQIDGAGAAYRFEYDADHQVITAVVNPLGQRYEYTLDAAGRVIEEVDYAGSRTRYRYDAAGQLVEKTDACGQTTRYAYNALGQCVLEQADGEPPTRYEYDTLGRLVLAENADSVLRFRYDADGNLVEEQQNEAVLAYAFDADGLCVERALALPGLPEPHRTVYGFDGNGLLTRLRLPGAALLELGYDASGRLIQAHSRRGFTLQQRFTPTGLLAEQRAGAAFAHTVGAPMPPQAPKAGATRPSLPEPHDVRVQRRYRFDRSGLPSTISDNAFGEWRYRYDAAARVVEAAGPLGRECFDYGPVGEVTQASRLQGQGRTERWRQSHFGGRIISRAGESYRYDAAGRLIEKTVEREGFRPQRWLYRYNARGELIGLRRPDGQAWRYAYDPLGRRIEKRNEASGWARRSVWDGDVLAAEQVGEYADNVFLPDDEAEVWVYQPERFIPLAKQRLRVTTDPYAIAHYQTAFPGEQPPPTIHTWYALTDYLGTPKALLSEAGEVAWRGEQAVWGELVEERGIAQTELKTDCPLRFQGQYADAESGLHYNRFRYYDPQSTQYLTPDPIGLLGGLTPQGYVPNPLEWVDPLGLKKCSVPKRIKPRLEDGNSKEGWQHIDERHVTGNAVGGHGDLFPPGTTRAQIEKAINKVVMKGVRVSDASRRIQTYEKRVRVNGRSDRVRVVVDSHDGNRVITAFPVRGGK